MDLAYVERVDNPIRRHSMLGYVSSINFGYVALIAEAA